MPNKKVTCRIKCKDKYKRRRNR